MYLCDNDTIFCRLLLLLLIIFFFLFRSVSVACWCVFANVECLCVALHWARIVNSREINRALCKWRNAFGFSVSLTSELHISSWAGTASGKNRIQTQTFPSSFSVYVQFFETQKCRKTDEQKKKKEELCRAISMQAYRMVICVSRARLCTACCRRNGGRLLLLLLR